VDPFLDLIETDWLLNSDIIRHLIVSILVILFLVMGRWLIMRAVKSQTHDITLLYKWSKGSTYVAGRHWIAAHHDELDLRGRIHRHIPGTRFGWAGRCLERHIDEYRGLVVYRWEETLHRG